MEIEIRKANTQQVDPLFNLYRAVAGLKDGLIRRPDEITQDYVAGFLGKSQENGLCLVAHFMDEVIGEIHATTPGIFAFQHLLTDLTIVVHPNYQGKGVGRKLFALFLDTIQNEYSHILRVELYTREHNHRNIKFYESLGFVNEGRQHQKIYSSHERLETPLHMAWFNPFYNS
ncbi:MAG: N-acetyltransferase [Bacteroidota bacterium]